MNVVNKKGFAIKVDKIWADAQYTSSHGDIYIALFNKDSGAYVQDTLRKLVSPNTSVSYYFDQQTDAERCVAREVQPISIQPTSWSDPSDVTGCIPWPDAKAYIDGDGVEYTYTITYETGETFGGTGSNVRTDTVTNDRSHLRIRKQSSLDDKPLQGAVFTLTDTNTNKTMTFTSAQDGNVTDAYLIPGHTYTLTETAAPNGYTKLTSAVTIKVAEDGVLSITSPNNSSLVQIQIDVESRSGTLIIKNVPQGIILKKTDEGGTPLKGAVFTITKLNYNNYYNNRYWTKSTVLNANVTSDDNGIFYGGAPTDGYYLIEEITPPNGYQKLEKDVVMQVTNGKVDGLFTVNYNGSQYTKYQDIPFSQPTGSSQTISIENKRAYADLYIEKTITGLDASKGYPTFMFKVTQTKDANGDPIANGQEYIRCISYSAGDVDATKDVTLEDLPIGTYRVEELSSLNYQAIGLSVSGDDHAITSGDHLKAIVTLSSSGAVTVSYKNELGDRELYHTAYADNIIDYPEAGGQKK